MKLLTAEQVLFIHDRIIEETGGKHGLRDRDLLEAAVVRPLSGVAETEFYPTLHDKAAALMDSLIRNHPFVDGNKRTGLTAAGVLLSMNGWDLIASHRETYDVVLRIAGKLPAERPLGWEEISAWLMDRSQRRNH